MLRGIAIDPDRAERASGVPYSTIENLFTHLQKARYGATFFGPSLGGGAEGRRAHEAMLTLIRDLNEARRFVGLELGEPGNPSGAASVLSWQAGAPSSVDFGAGYPRHLPGEASLKSRLDAGQVDAVLIVGETLPDAITLKKMVGVRSIRLWPVATEPMTSTVSINVARPGIETGGTVARIDGVMLPLRPLVPSHLPTDRQVLDAISERLQNSQ
jgi:formylmethanofuran dehydrogenase subunit B